MNQTATFSKRFRVWLGFIALLQLYLVWATAQNAADWAADGRWFWPLGAFASVVWLWLSYGNARALVRGKWG